MVNLNFNTPRKTSWGMILGVAIIMLIITGFSFVVKDNPNINKSIPILEEKLTAGTWYANTFSFLGFGDTWAYVISSIALILILGFGFFDILYSFGLFGQRWINEVIAICLAIIFAVSGLATKLALFLFTLVGGIGVAAVAIGIIVPFLVFIEINLVYRKLMHGTMVKEKAQDVVDGAVAVSSAIEALGKTSGAFRKGYKQAEKEADSP
ncbi:MAG: hypothetical protein AABX11_02030 [Nanoarchaeota archaeon]